MAKNGNTPPDPSFGPEDFNEEHFNPQVEGGSDPFREEGDYLAGSLPSNPTVRPVSLGKEAPAYGTPTGSIPGDGDAEAIDAYKTIEARKRKRRRKRLIAGLVGAVLVLGVLGWWTYHNMPSGQENEDMPAFDTGMVVQQDYESSVSASGAISPASQVVVTPEVDGIIQEIRVAEGDIVSKGDVLFILKNDALDKAVQDAEQGVKSANNGLVAAQNSLNSAYSNLNSAQSNYDKVFSTGFDTQELADAAGAEATDALLAAQDALSGAQLGVENAEISLATAEEALEQARITAEKRTVLAPEGGAIVAMNAEVGASVGTAGSAQSGSGSLLTIADLNSLRVRVQVNEVDINKLAEGQGAEVSFSALTDLVLNAQIDHIAAISSSGNTDAYYGGGGIVTYDVDLVIPEPDPRVKPGMTARVKIITENIEGALTVPTAALQMLDDAEAIILVAPGYDGEGAPSFEERKVAVLAQDPSTAVVEGDVADGDTVQIFLDGMGGESGWEVKMAG